MATKSKLFRVATEGATTDGRVIQKDWIAQMAKNFDPKKYGARVWLEHYRGIAPDGLFKAYGDVVAVEARQVEDDKLALFAQIAPLPELVSMTKSKQKIYTSIECTPKFSDTGEAYLTGLAVTDSPASLGTEVLEFASRNQAALANRKSHAEALFTQAIEADLQFEDDGSDEESVAKKFASALQGVKDKLTGKSRTDDTRFADMTAVLDQAGNVIAEQAQKHGALKAEHDTLSTHFNQLQARFDALLKKLDMAPENHSQRPPATGNSGRVQTDF
ncbi:phage capsid protein [Verminephrobacter aporrectodeae subsp. tuberculatae]|uniref:Phage capsid protein n=1 Tax=Verminephrobacter aporrectodeae subsp. tuberculatae TaxID=1110392 RepID=A0ABT3KQE3_9BURK|nr:GPO family capsid scaffolding protein [Verminephrobacter aporrectodeae]MCW5320536.1 phage capsid protein [Verminephrobacter aporrectodeae subsp. tuberculatae]